MIRVVVTGSECTGKTTLAAALARHFETAWSREYVREFVEQMGRPPLSGDVDAIASGQIALEDEAARRSSRLVILDTDLLSTVIYSHHYFGGCPFWVEEAAAERAGDLYLLADIDVPWVEEVAQRDRGDRREEMQALFRDELRRRSLPYRTIRGGPGERLAAAVSLVDELLRET